MADQAASATTTMARKARTVVRITPMVIISQLKEMATGDPRLATEEVVATTKDRRATTMSTTVATATIRRSVDGHKVTLARRRSMVA